MKKLALVFTVPLCLLVAVYLLLAWYYHQGFAYGTWINHVYCTGKTVEEVNQELTRNYTIEPLTILLKNGETVALERESFQYQISFDKSLQEFQQNQVAFFWIKNIIAPKNQVLLPQGSFDVDLAKKEIASLPFIKEAELIQEYDVIMKKTDQGYVLQDTTQGMLDAKRSQEVLLKALLEGETQISLEEMLCYLEIPITQKMEETKALWGKVAEFQDFYFTYQFGEETEVIDASVVCEWIALEDDGTFLLDEVGNLVLQKDKLEGYITYLAEKYNTYNITRSFQTTEGRVVEIKGGTYGNQLNQKVEKAYLMQAFQDRREEVRVPEYEKKALYQGLDDIGDTYIEIDMTYQTMYYYEDGVLIYETPVVTGNESWNMLTPAKVCFVYFMQRNRVLRGPGYATPVDYWMAVYGGIGIHDAKWKSEFGGEIYKKDGSHGCINTPYDIVSGMYERITVGTPVLMYY